MTEDHLEVLERVADIVDGDKHPNLSNTIRELVAEVQRLRARLSSLTLAISRNDDEIQQTLARALGYPRYADDPKNFPGATDANGVCVGEHVAITLAIEAAKWIRQAEADRDRLARDLAELRRETANPRIAAGD